MTSPELADCRRVLMRVIEQRDRAVKTLSIAEETFTHLLTFQPDCIHIKFILDYLRMFNQMSEGEHPLPPQPEGGE